MFWMFSTMERAINNGDLNEVKRLVSIDNENKNKRYTLPNGYTPLIHAAEKDELEIVKFLVKAGARITDAMFITNTEGKRVPKYTIDFAIEKQNWATAQTLFTELVVSCAQDIDRLVDIINKGIRYKLSINIPSILSGNTILTLASKNGDINIARLLIENYDVDILVAVNNKKAWEFAANTNHWDIVRLLFEAHSARCLRSDENIEIYLNEITKLFQLLLGSLEPSAKLKLFIIRESDHTTISSIGSSTDSVATVSNESEDRILLQISTATPSHSIFKLVCSRTTKKWHMAFSRIGVKDLDVLNDYHQKIIDINIENYQRFFSAITRAIHNSDNAMMLSEIEAIASLQSSSYEKVDYRILAGREYTGPEKIRLQEREIALFKNDIQSRISLLEEQIDQIKGKFTSGQLTDVEDSKQELKQKLNQIENAFSKFGTRIEGITERLRQAERNINGLAKAEDIRDSELIMQSGRSKESLGIDSDDKEVYAVYSIKYDNPCLNNPRISKILKELYQSGGIKAIDELIDLGEDVQLAKAMIDAIEYYGKEHVIRIVSATNQGAYPQKDAIPSHIQENFFLNNPQGVEFVQAVADNFDENVLNAILELGEDSEIAEQILAEAELQGIDMIVYRLLGKEIPEIGSTDNLKNIISTDELNQLQLIPNGIFNSWSNKPYLKIVEYIDKLAKNLDDMLNVGKSGDQVVIIITLLEEWLNFAASGQRLVVCHNFYHGDHDEDYPYSGGSGSNGENHNNSAESFALHQGFTSAAIMPLYNETYNITDYQM